MIANLKRLSKPSLELGGEELGGEELGGEEEETLLAEPGKRDEYTKPGWKKSYKPVAKRGGDRRKRGARYRSNISKGGDSIARNTRQNVSKGYSDLSTLANLTYENKDTTYSKEEEMLFEVNYEMKQLINASEQDNESKT